MFIAKNNDLIILASQTREELEQQLQFMVYTDIEETDKEYELYNGEYLTKEEIEIKERERLNLLSLTRGDVFRGLLQAKGVTKAQIRSQIEKMPDGIQKEMALIDFDDALNFFRGNQLIDIVGLQLGITSEQLDKFFETNDYHELLPVEPTEPTEPEETIEPEKTEEDNLEEVIDEL